MKTTQVIKIFSWFLFYENVIKLVVVSAHQRSTNQDIDLDELIDKNTRKLKPITKVIDDHMMASRDFPRIIDCGPDETQNWYEPDPEDCSCYFVCTGKFYVHRQCNAGLLFDTKNHDCNWPEVVECGNRPAPWTIPEYAGPHHNPHHYHLYEYLNSEKIQRKNEKGRLLGQLDEDLSDGKDTEYELFM